jgi:hypothetical protein
MRDVKVFLTFTFTEYGTVLTTKETIQWPTEQEYKTKVDIKKQTEN